VEATIDDGTYTRLFSGVAKVPQETGGSVDGAPLVRFTCRSRDELLLQKRMSTAWSTFRALLDSGATEGQIIAQFLSDAGYTGTSLDAGYAAIPYAWLDAESPLEDIWAIAAAAGGRIYADAQGVVRYENMAHWLRSPHTTVQQAYTRDDWTNFGVRWDDREIYDSVTVEYASRQPEAETVLWEPDELVTVPADSTITQTAIFRYPAYTVTGVTWKANLVGGGDMTGWVSVTPTWFAQRADLVIANTHPTQAVVMRPLRVTGQPLVGGPSAEEQRNSAEHGSNAAFFSTRGSRDRSIRGNPYIQSRAQAGMLAQFMLDRFERPRLFYSVTGVPGNPARQPGDRVSFSDPTVMPGGAREAIVLAVGWTISSSGYVQTLEAMDAASLYPSTGTAPGYFLISTSGGSKLGSGDAARGCLFY
jgi:hypothetical protein